MKTEYAPGAEHSAPGDQAGGVRLLESLRRYKERFTIAMRAAGICVYEVDLQNQRYTFFENAEAIFGKDGDTILRDVAAFSDLPPQAYCRAVSGYFSHPDDHPAVARAFAAVLTGQPVSYQARMCAGDEDYTWCKIDVVPVLQDGEPIFMVGVVSNIDPLKRRADFFEAAAHMDSLTGLYNRRYGEAYIERVLRREPGGPHALLLVDLDAFKQLNDTHGHTAGDGALKQVADQLRTAFGPEAMITRWGGDEFVVFVHGAGWCGELPRQIDRFLKDPLQWGATKSMGLARWPQHGKSYQALFSAADAALYQAKKRRSCCVVAESQ